MSKISLVISDVDGTLVTSEKVLTERNRAAVVQLQKAGLGFTIMSSRPPFGLRMLIEPLGLRLPIGAFNGAVIAAPDLSIIEQRTLASDVARQAIAVLRLASIEVWAFTASHWMAEDQSGAYVDKEIRTILVQPTIVTRLEDNLEGVVKLVGVSEDFNRLASCELEVRKALTERATIARSQSYYLDITPAGTDKGVGVMALARRLNVPVEEIVTIGDMENDVPMFRRSGFSIAMGNATPEVKQAAHAVTLSNEQDGVAYAAEHIILPRASGA
jgi:Cof subfamily protein (haloacid dehalogenase superfamily)